MSGRWFPWHSKVGGCRAPIHDEVFFSEIMATEKRSNNLYGLKTLYVQSSRHLRIIKMVFRRFDIFYVFMTSSMLHFYIILQFLAMTIVINCVETLDLINLQSFMCNRLRVVEVLRHRHRKSAISNTIPVYNDELFVKYVFFLRSSCHFTSRYAL